MSVNKAILIGRAVADPEIREANGKKFAKMRIATSESWRDRTTGERKERSEFHNVSVFSEGLTKVIEQHIRKGSRVYLEGMLKTHKYQGKDGQDRYSTDVVLQGFNGVLQMLDSASGASAKSDAYAKQGDASRYDPPSEDARPRTTYDAKPLEDEVPF